MSASALSYSSGASDLPLLGETLGANFGRIVDRFGDRDALIDQPSGRRWSYRRLAEDIERVAAGLLERGIRRGDRVGVWAPSSAEWFMVQYATAKIGAILVPINPAYRQQELQYVLNHAEIRLVVSAERFKTSDYRAMLDAAAPETPSVAEVPDPRMGEELMVWIKMRPGAAPLDAAAIKDFCTGKLAHFKIPRYVHVVDEFPMTVTGKIRKVEMRELSRQLINPAPPQ